MTMAMIFGFAVNILALIITIAALSDASSKFLQFLLICMGICVIGMVVFCMIFGKSKEEEISELDKMTDSEWKLFLAKHLEEHGCAKAAKELRDGIKTVEDNEKKESI